MSLPSIDEQRRILKECRERPEKFFENILGVGTIWEKQVETANSVRDNRRTTVKSCHASGKTFISACIALWFLQCFDDSIVITTAPTWKQVEKVLWGEIRNLFKKSTIPLAGTCLNTSIRIDEKWYAIGLSTDQGDNIQGWHSKHVLVIIDEATGVDEQLHKAVRGLMTDDRCRLLMIGNPTVCDGEFYRSFQSTLYNKITISAFDTPNVKAGKTIIEGLCSSVWVEEMREESGEDSALWISRVLGEFPDEADDVLVPLRWVERAETQELRLQGYEPRILAIDVARFGTNDTVFLPRIGNKVILMDGKIPFHQGKDINVTLGRTIQIMEKFRPDIVMIDDDGIGGALYDMLWRKYNNVFSFVNNATPYDTHFTNRKAEVYWALREKFREGLMDIPKNTKITAQLPSIKYEPHESSGAIRIIPKRQTKAQKDFDSPDFADALMLSEAAMEALGENFEPDVETKVAFGGNYYGFGSREEKGGSRTGY